jgi:hypothetical protein
VDADVQATRSLINDLGSSSDILQSGSGVAQFIQVDPSQLTEGAGHLGDCGDWPPPNNMSRIPPVLSPALPYLGESQIPPALATFVESIGGVGAFLRWRE